MLGRIPIKENINNARKILCVSRIFGEILIDKDELKILNNDKDITNKCKDVDSNSLTLGNVLYKMLNSQIDEECREYIREFNGIKLY